MNYDKNKLDLRYEFSGFRKKFMRFLDIVEIEKDGFEGLKRGD